MAISWYEKFIGTVVGQCLTAALFSSFSVLCCNSSFHLSSQCSSSLGFLFHFQFHTSELSEHLELAPAGTKSNCPATFDTGLIQFL